MCACLSFPHTPLRRLTDSKGRTVAFNNTIIIMTSNLVGD